MSTETKTHEEDGHTYRCTIVKVSKAYHSTALGARTPFAVEVRRVDDQGRPLRGRKGFVALYSLDGEGDENAFELASLSWVAAPDVPRAIVQAFERWSATSAKTAARRLAGHILMAKAFGWSLPGSSDVGRASKRPFVKRWPFPKSFAEEIPSVADDFCEIFVSIAGPIAIGEIDNHGDTDVAHALSIMDSAAELPDFAATVRDVLVRHARTLDSLTAAFLSGDRRETTVDEVIKATEPDLVRSIRHPRAMVPSHVPGWKPLPDQPAEQRVASAPN